MGCRGGFEKWPGPLLAGPGPPRRPSAPPAANHPLECFASLSQSIVICLVVLASRTARAECCDRSVCNAGTVIEAWWTTSTRSPCTKARGSIARVVGTAGNRRTLRSSSGARGTGRQEENGRRILITSRKGSPGRGRSGRCRPRPGVIWPVQGRARQGRGPPSRRRRRGRLTSGWKNLTTKHKQLQVCLFLFCMSSLCVTIIRVVWHW